MANDVSELMAARQWDAAIERLQQSPQNEESCGQLVRCYAVRGMLQQLIETWFRLMDILEAQHELDLVLELARKVLRIQPENDRARMRIILI
ncbi:MAG: hypothetical protein ACYCW6_32530, partial [Candidatus Xenobia bacterium]